jgi:diaminohydroxyphosphoribosylaminopyrimidine deaminase/5-amino-6-(5-phosphoribosylamino)uracil reductase
VDRLELYYGPVVVGDGPALADLGVGTLADARRWRATSVERVGDDVAVTLRRSG